MLGEVDLLNLDVKFPIIFNGEYLKMYVDPKLQIKTVSKLRQELLLFTIEHESIDDELMPLDMPKLINMAFNLRKCEDYFLDIFSNDIYTNSAHYFTTNRHGERFYFVGHSAGLLSESTYVLQRNGDEKNDESSKLIFNPTELNLFNKKNYQYDLISLEDLRAGKTLDKFITYVNLDAEPVNKLPFVALSETEFMTSDIVLMQCGGVKARAKLAKIYFQDLNYQFIQNTTCLDDDLFKEHYGQQLIFSTNDGGIQSHFNLSNEGRMLAVSRDLTKNNLEKHYSYFKMDNHGVPESKIKR
jgi:hypothetical protein